MDFKAKKVVFFTCVGILLFHFAMLGFYALPDGWKNPYLNSLNRWYVLPQFHHNFVVFAPDPPLSNQHFVFRFQKQYGQWTSWQ